jgi:uncharacterized protein (TIGR02118 family)
MFTMSIYYKVPNDPEGFEKRYIEGHLPLVREYANIKETAFTKVGRVMAGDFPYTHVFTATWADRDAWKADMNSPAAAAAMEDAKALPAEGFDIVTFETLA